MADFREIIESRRQKAQEAIISGSEEDYQRHFEVLDSLAEALRANGSQDVAEVDHQLDLLEAFEAGVHAAKAGKNDRD